MENQIIPGVFCDVQGTLLDYNAKKVNQDVLEMLEKYEKEGKKVYLWTGGDVDEYREKLHRMGISQWRVLSKYDFRNSTVEIAIDDQPETKIAKDYGIRASQFIFYKRE